MIEDGVRLLGNVELGRDVSIGTPGEINGRGSFIRIGDGCDIASYVTVTALSSHKRCIGLSSEIERKPVTIGHHVFIGQGAIVLGGTEIGHHSVIGAGVVLAGQKIPPYSRVTLPAPIIKAGHYAQRRV